MLELRNITFTYPKAKEPVFSNYSVGFEPGATTAITGASGKGKSTLLYITSLLLRPNSGEIIDDDLVVSELSDGEQSAWRANRIGFIFQDAILDPAQTILENVCEGAFYSLGFSKAIESRAQRLLEQAGVVSRFDHRPGEISGGQAQRVALCRALLTMPAIVLADEPTGNLDEESANVVWAMLQDSANNGACVLIATHDKVRASSCDNQIHV